MQSSAVQDTTGVSFDKNPDLDSRVASMCDLGLAIGISKLPRVHRIRQWQW
jgi:hypothetical protein